MGLRDTLREAAASQMGDIGGEHLGELARVFAAMEHEQLAAANDLLRAADIGGFEHLPDPEERQAALQEMFEALLSGTFVEWWIEQIAAEQFDRAPPEELVGCGTDSKMWADQIAEWATQLGHAEREESERELAAEAVSEVYGSSIEEFEEVVIEMDPQTEAQRILAGNFRAVRGAMRQATGVLEKTEGNE